MPIRRCFCSLEASRLASASFGSGGVSVNIMRSKGNSSVGGCNAASRKSAGSAAKAAFFSFKRVESPYRKMKSDS